MTPVQRTGIYLIKGDNARGSELGEVNKANEMTEG
jgi:hypothetical protein